MQSNLPYDLQEYDNGQCYFETDLGLIYTYNFENVTSGVIERVSPILACYDMTFHYFGFNANRSDNLEYDPRIVSTINSITTDFFQDSQKVMLYVCDSMDGRAAARQRLFSRWAESKQEFQHTKIEISLGEDDVIYCGIITRADIPNRDILEQEFIEQSYNVFTEKFN